MNSDSLEPADLDYAEVVEGRYETIEAVLDSLVAAIARVREDRGLTPEGKGARIRSLGEATLREIEAIGIPPRVARDLEAAEAALPAVLPIPPEPFADDPRRRNPIRLERRVELVLARLAGMADAGDPLSLANALRSAARLADPLPLIAAQRAPRFVLNVADEVVAAAVDEYHRTVNADAYARRETLRRVVRIIESNLASARTRVDSLVSPDLRAASIAATAIAG